MKIKPLPLIELYRQLIATPSISAINPTFNQSNKAIINLLSNWLNDLGFEIEIQAIPNSYNKFNMLASFGNFSPGGLLLSGHTDTVPFDDNHWTYDPFKLTEFDNKLYGLGTTDMKGFFALVIDAIKDIELKKLKKPLFILATADEETSMIGAKYFSESSNLSPDFGFIGEPTSLELIHSHKGYISQIFSVQGKTGHSSNPLSGINAIEIMNLIMLQLIKLKYELKKICTNNQFTIPYSTLNFGYIHGGKSSNQIAANCELHVEIRTIPNLSIKKIKTLLKKSMNPINQRWSGRLKINNLHIPVPFYQYPKHKQQQLEKIAKLLNTSIKSVNYCTEASFIQKICPILILGPGSIEQAHKPNEFIDKKFFNPTKIIIKKLIKHFCN